MDVRAVRLAGLNFVPSLDVFNVANSNTIQAIQAIVAPRVILTTPNAQGSTPKHMGVGSGS